ncbi:FAD/NAD(P)-binding domain-containing protein [Choiromyces venosus 120613-1]|uniref:L-ornithine N(5)-monooxygenase [NAD(P)H] n=1 Tax=Choiromyces venosus 120613-1 TaxID=1336337 RepID=A0A3N4K7W0_9PEZI|nr:FAD/NAD(P)-binding domain-containing protein [Choiromyces venosus 120613-1]
MADIMKGYGSEHHLNGVHGSGNGCHSNGTTTFTNILSNGHSTSNSTNGIHKNGHSTYHNGNSTSSSNTDSHNQEPYDLICIGFGPASLAIAIALHDQKTQARVLFLERQPEFAWHAGMILPGSRMQISFIKDLATLRNPRSEFTFLNYLHEKNRLVTFTNLGTFLPLREEYNDYMAWCASHFEDYVRYGQDVVSVAPVGEKPIQNWTVTSRDIENGQEKRLTARHVVIAVGGKPNIPKAFPQNPLNSRIIHSSGYSSTVPKILNDKNKAYKIAVVGGGQSAAEIFNDMHTRYPNSKTSLIIKGSALRPSDDSPFVNEIFDPSRVDSVYSMPTEIRGESIVQDRATNYGVVRLELIEHLYETFYHQRLQNPSEAEWQHRIVPLREVARVEENKLGELHLQLKNTRTGEAETTAGFDAIIVATGYVRNVHEALLKPARGLLEGNSYQVNRDYRVQFKEGAVATNSGVWLQGCCESTHGLSDTLLSVLAVRGGGMVESIFGKEMSAANC